MAPVGQDRVLRARDPAKPAQVFVDSAPFPVYGLLSTLVFYFVGLSLCPNSCGSLCLAANEWRTQNLD